MTIAQDNIKQAEQLVRDSIGKISDNFNASKCTEVCFAITKLFYENKLTPAEKDYTIVLLNQFLMIDMVKSTERYDD